MLYRIIHTLITLAIRIYYREIRIKNENRIPKTGPVLIISNHPNTLMDAWMMGLLTRRRIYFMAKGTFFNSSIKRFFLRMIGLIPVNRSSDGATKGVSNKASLEACFNVLEEGKVLVIFPEGNSYLERKLRDLKTGAARIALGVGARGNSKEEIAIVPVGLNYIGANNFRGSVVIEVGKPILLNDNWNEMFAQNEQNAVLKLTGAFKKALLYCLHTIDDEVIEEVGDELTRLFYTKYQSFGDFSSYQDFNKYIHERLEEIKVTAPWKLELIRDLTMQFNGLIKFYGIQSSFLDRTFRPIMFARQTVQSILFLLVTIPIFIFGFLIHFIPYNLIGAIVSRLVKDVEYHAPVVVIFGIFLYPIFYYSWWYFIDMNLNLPHLVSVLFIITCPFIGLFTHFFVRYSKHMRMKGQFLRFAMRSKTVYNQLKNDRFRIRELIFND